MAKDLAQAFCMFSVAVGESQLECRPGARFPFLSRWIGLDEGQRKWKKHLLYQARRRLTLSCKEMYFSPSEQSMNAELGLLTCPASHSLAYSGFKATQMTLLLDHWARWLCLFLRIVLISCDRLPHGSIVHTRLENWWSTPTNTIPVAIDTKQNTPPSSPSSNLSSSAFR